MSSRRGFVGSPSEQFIRDKKYKIMRSWNTRETDKKQTRTSHLKMLAKCWFTKEKLVFCIVLKNWPNRWVWKFTQRCIFVWQSSCWCQKWGSSGYFLRYALVYGKFCSFFWILLSKNLFIFWSPKRGRMTTKKCIVNSFVSLHFPILSSGPWQEEPEG